MEAKIIPLEISQYPLVKTPWHIRKKREIIFKKECRKRLRNKITKNQSKFIWLNIFQTTGDI